MGLLEMGNRDIAVASQNCVTTLLVNMAICFFSCEECVRVQGSFGRVHSSQIVQGIPCSLVCPEVTQKREKDTKKHKTQLTNVYS